MTTSLSHPTPAFFGDFRALFTKLIPLELLNKTFSLMGPRGGGAPKLTPHLWLMALVHHALAKAGTFATHVARITGIVISDAALSMRKSSFGWEILAALLPEVLAPMAQRSLHPEAFHGGLRLVALDGTRWNLRNTKALNASARQPQQGPPGAFAQMLCSVLIELGSHSPWRCLWAGRARGNSPSHVR